MSMTTTDPKPSAADAAGKDADSDAGLSLRKLRRDGLLALWGRLRHRDNAAYEAWLEERDMIMITAALLRLNDRQLARIGMQRSTLALDVEDLALRSARERDLGREILELVRDSAPERRALAAE